MTFYYGDIVYFCFIIKLKFWMLVTKKFGKF